MKVLTETPRHPLPDGEAMLLGASSSVTGAMTRVAVPDLRLLVDAGTARGADADRWALPLEQALDVDAVVLTHAHHDHVGSLPALLDAGFAGPLYGTPATLEIARIVLVDSMRLEEISPSARVAILARFDAQASPVAYGRAFRPVGARTEIALFEAGHILGSSSVEIRSAGSRVVISGDLGRYDAPLLRDPHGVWDDDRPIDLVVMESTYGDREHRDSPAAIGPRLETVLRRAIDRRGHVLVPAFAIGRTQTLLHHLNALVEDGRIPPIPVAIDTPMGLRVTETYADFRRLFDAEALDRIARGDDPLDFDSLYAVWKGRDSDRLRDVEGPMVIVAGSGMCTGGRIVEHLVELLPREATTLLFVGFQAPGTPGRRIQDAARAGDAVVEIDGRAVALRGRVETLSGLSAHADRRELARWLGKLPAVARVALHHGEPKAQRALAAYLEARHR
jgi:metallo-beta-lactamase family protein